MTKPTPSDAGQEVIRREMPVDADGRAVGATVVVYASGQAQHFAYYAACLTCVERYPFFSPSDRDTWTEAHRAACLNHAVELTVEPWDYVNPPWIAAYGLPLTADRSLL
jgi:hypothetical protein